MLQFLLTVGMHCPLRNIMLKCKKIIKQSFSDIINFIKLCFNCELPVRRYDESSDSVTSLSFNPL